MLTYYRVINVRTGFACRFRGDSNTYFTHDEAIRLANRLGMCNVSTTIVKVSR